MKAGTVVTLGESMILLSGDSIGEPSPGDKYRLDSAGSESNVAVGVSRLGHDSAWIGRVGDDSFGRLIERNLRGEGVDTSGMTIDADASTGLMLSVPRTSQNRSINYWRSDSAASKIRPKHLPKEMIERAACLHTSGIALAIGATAAETAVEAMAYARSCGVVTSFDLNYRSSLWTSEAAVFAYKQALAMSDIVFASIDEARMVADGIEPYELAAHLSRLGPSQVVLTLGAMGSVARVGDETVKVNGRNVPVVDTTGAGDALAAGYLCGWMEGMSPLERLNLANDVASISVGTMGDWRGLPYRSELPMLVDSRDSHIR